MGHSRLGLVAERQRVKACTHVVLLCFYQVQGKIPERRDDLWLV